jgi:hypothetical protein
MSDPKSRPRVFATDLHSEVIFKQPGGLPAMRAGDMVSVVQDDHGRILCISDLSLGVEMSYRPAPPFRNEKGGENLAVYAIIVSVLLPFLGYALAASGFPLQTAFYAGAIGGGFLVWFISYWGRMNNHNVRLTNRVQECVKNACLNVAIWDIPEPEELEGESWKD